MTKISNRLIQTAVALLAITAASLPVLAQWGPAGGGNGTCCITATGPANETEAKRLAFMREEEKLARDVYTQLYAKWKLRLFDNISRSEERHYEAIGGLMTRYEVADPSKGLAPGVYADAELTKLYATLMANGLTSVKDALEVGVAIEKQDIADLETGLKETDKTDIKTVYTNLMAGSLNHQDAFEHVLEVMLLVP